MEGTATDEHLPTEDKPMEMSMLFRPTAEQGNPVAMCSLAKALRDEGKTAEADEWLNRAASMGHAPAMRELVVLLSGGDSDASAQSWFERAIETDEATSSLLSQQFRKLGRPEEALLWLARGVELGDSRAMVQMAFLSEDSEPDEQLLRASADADDSGGMLALGALLSKSGRGEEGLTWLIKALGYDAVGAGVQIGLHYERTGEAEKADRYFRQVAISGSFLKLLSMNFTFKRLGRTAEFNDFLRHGIEEGNPAALSLQDWLDEVDRVRAAEDALDE